MLDDDDPRASYNAHQANLLAGRRLQDLDPVERMQFVDLQSSPFAGVQPDKFKLDPKKTAHLDPFDRLRAANGEITINRGRAKLRAFRDQLRAADPSERSSIERRMAEVSKEVAGEWADWGAFGSDAFGH